MVGPLHLPPVLSVPHGMHRGLLDLEEAKRIESLFSALASVTRLRILHAILRMGQPCLSALAGVLGMKPQAVSNQLRRMLDMGILQAQRKGNHVHYSLQHAEVRALLVHGLEISKRTR